MKTYIVSKRDPVINNQLIDIFPTGVGGALQLPNKKHGDSIAKARSGNVMNRGDVYAERAVFTSNYEFAYVSGLTHCIGIIIGEKGSSGNGIIRASVAHYNLGWKKTTGIEDQKSFFGPGRKYGVMLASAAANGEDMKRMKEEFQRRLINIGIDDYNIILYHSASDPLCFGVCADGTVGEITDQYIALEVC